jgi:hypothetical protein
MLDTFKSEARMFRVVIKVGLGAAAVIVLTLLTDAFWGALLGLALIAFWIASAWAGRREAEAEAERPASASSGPPAASSGEPRPPERPPGPSTGL